MPNRHTGYCRTLGIISATRAPLLRPRPCKNAPNAADNLSRSAKVIVRPMHENAGRDPNFAQLSSSTSRSDAYSLTSISAGMPAGEDVHQIFSNFPPSGHLALLLSDIVSEALGAAAGGGHLGGRVMQRAAAE